MDAVRRYELGGRQSNQETQLPTHISRMLESGVVQAQKNGKGVFVGLAPCLLASDSKQPPLVIETERNLT